MVFQLKRILRAKGMNITKLSLITGISRNTISLLVHEKSQGIKFDTLYKIADALDVSIGELFEQSKYDEIYKKARKYDVIKKTILKLEEQTK
ncbi:helix-turn-helix transcriptional regulator [Staphylococcus saprophyticus]|nr:helix-turn-helix transcriptional regulator [Staphylococcus saprophyticus]